VKRHAIDSNGRVGRRAAVVEACGLLVNRIFHQVLEDQKEMGIGISK
jgi:hypothetical protein